MSMTRMREAIAAIVALLLVFVMAVAATGVFGWNIPVLSNLANMLGIGGP